MSEKTRAELKEQIKIMNHNYQVIKEMHEKGYQYSVGEVKRLQDELERTRKALDVALDWLGQVATPEKCDDDLCREFTKRKLAEIKIALEQKDVK